MSDTPPKPSRFWGGTPRRIKWLVRSFFVLFVALGLLIGYFLFREMIWRSEATRFASEAGFIDARKYYLRGTHCLLEIATFDVTDMVDKGAIPMDYETRPSGRQVDGFDIYLLYQDRLMGSPLRITQASYVKSFNHAMRTMCANPDWIGPDGGPLQPGGGQTNRPPFKRISE